MVAITASTPVTWDAPSKPQAFSWVGVPVQDIFDTGLRLEASVYATEAKQAERAILSNQYGCIAIRELAEIYHCPRFKRVFVDISEFPIYQPSQISELNPSPAAFVSDKTEVDLNALRVLQGQILMTCSGTVGNVTLVSKTLANRIFSHDLLRIGSHKQHYAGYLYTYFRSKQGRTLIQSNNYGAVIQHIEPAHLLSLPIPNAPELLKTHIHHTVTESFNLRDESNELMALARNQLQNALALPNVEELNPPANAENGLHCFNVNVANLNHRFEANYHNPLAQAITQHLHKHAARVLPLGDGELTKQFVLPGRFKRVYVEKGHGVVFFSGKDIGELDPTDKKYLSFSQHDKKIKNELTIKQNMLLITCSGTLGNVALVPKHWDEWTMTHDIVRLVPSSEKRAGYLYAWLSSEWGRELIKRSRYGAVVQHIEIEHVAETPVPLLADTTIMQDINNLVLKANELRYQAFQKEQEALDLFNQSVLGL